MTIHETKIFPKSSNLKILFISQYAARTGTPILLLRLIEKIKLYSNFEILILLKSDGELRPDFERLGKTFIWSYKTGEDSQPKSLIKLRNRLGIRKHSNQETYKAEIIQEINEADFVFNNTITNAELLKELPLDGKKVFSYFHELQAVTGFLSSQREIEYVNTISEKIFVPALFVKQFFIDDYNIPEKKIELLKYIIPSPKELNNQFEKTKVLKQNGEKTFLAGFCGTLESRKGHDLLPFLAQKVLRAEKNVNIHFVWIGANKQSLEYYLLINDLRKLNLSSFFSFIEPVIDINPYLAQLDVLVLPSREDPFPLVVLEAAHHSVPCIYFSNAGGISEFSGNDAGIAIDYLDINDMANKIIQLRDDADFRRLLGKRAKEKIIEYSNYKKIVEDLLEAYKSPLLYK